MLALLSKALLVLMLVLLLPTGLVFASQDAVPGDRTYPIKRGLENVIVKVSSVHPTTRAFFKADMSKRRYKEAVALVKRGDTGSQSSLIELVTQTEAAAEDIGEISDPKVKQELVDNLSKQIVQYKAGLNKLETANIEPPVVPAAQPATQPVVQPVQQAQPPVQAVQPTPLAQPTPITLPSSPPVGGPAPVAPPPIPVAPSGSIRNTIDDLEAINERLHNLSKEIEKKKEEKSDRTKKKDEDRSNQKTGKD